MNRARRVVKNIFAQYFSQIMSVIFAIFFIINAARILGPEAFGRWSIVVTLVLFFGIFIDFGITILLQKEISRDYKKAEIYVGNVLVLMTLIGIVAYGISILASRQLYYSSEISSLMILAGITMIPRSLVNMLSGCINAFEKMEISGGMTAFFNGVNAVGGVALLHLGFGLKGYFLFIVISNIINCLFVLALINRKFFKIRVSIQFPIWVKLIKLCLPYGIMALLNWAYARINILILSHFQGEGAVGLYTASNSIREPLLLIPVGLNAALFPIMARYHINSITGLKSLYERSLRYLYTLSIPMAIGITILGDRVINLVYGEGYQGSGILLRIMAWSILFSFIHAPNVLFFLTSNMMGKLMIFSFIVAAVSIGFNILFISTLGILGSAIAVVSSDIFTFLLLFGSIYKFFKKVDIFNVIMKPTAAALIMGGGVLIFSNFNLFLIILLSFLLYVILIIAFGTLSSKDKKLFWSMIGRE